MDISSKPLAIILMGVSGSGKTAVGERLAQILAWPFYDGDNFHPPENITKMAHGIPLSDQDRLPWLASLNELIHRHLQEGRSLVLACSALKQAYRDLLVKGNHNTFFVYLKGDFDLIHARMQDRCGHYMKADMLRSQFDALEEPSNALVVDINQNIDHITAEVTGFISKICFDGSLQHRS